MQIIWNCMPCGVTNMEVTAKIQLFKATDAAEKLTCIFQNSGNNLCGVTNIPNDLNEGIDAFLPYKKEGTGASVDKENSFNRLGLFNILGSDKNYRYRFGITGTEEDISEKGYEYELTLVVESAEANKKLYGVIIHGDYAAEQYPRKARYCAITTDSNGSEIEGKKYDVSNSNTVFTIKFAEPARKVKIVLNFWNRPQYNACVTAVLPLTSYYTIDRNRLISVETKTQMCDNADDIKYGTLPGDGSLEANDYDGEICELLRYGIITKDSVVEICAGNNTVQSQLILSSDYDSEDKKVKFTLGDKLNMFEELNYSGMRIDKKAKSLKTILEDVLSVAGYSSADVAKLCQEEIYPEGDTARMSVAMWLERINVPYPYLESANLRETLDKICAAAQLFCYCDTKGELKFVSARPQFIPNKQIIRIPKDRTYGNSREDVFPKSKYNAVETTVKSLSLKKDDEIASVTLEFFKKENDTLNYLSEWRNNCDVDSVKLFLDGSSITTGVPDLVYFEKTFDVEPSVYMEEMWCVIKDERDVSSGDSTIAYDVPKDANTRMNKYQYANKNEFFAAYSNGNKITTALPSVDVFMGYCYNNTKCTVMMFVHLAKDDLTKLSRGIKLLADRYEVSDVKNHYFAS